MKKAPIARIALVQLSTGGKSYPMACLREDILTGNEVEVCAHSGSPREFYDYGVVTAIQFHRWVCSWRVTRLACEVDFGYELSVLDNPSQASIGEPASPSPTKELMARAPEEKLQIMARWSGKSAPDDELEALYDALSHDDGEPIYLSDGVWLTADGEFEDRGR
ncbi:hypothetical protein [Stutzerimonas kunmingensis]|uniref:hypothetical protein n=1 Tax=Stutzerimonas kunmingensis TaxID=1211807 RepID=UPI0028AEB3A6|nr:hypothetical protein [Stutzerimonas kunmingensis]